MIRVNLLPQEERVPEPKLTMQVPRARIWVSAVVIAAVLIPIGGVYLMQRVKIASLEADIQAAEVEHRRLKPQIDRINQLMEQREQLNERLAIIQTLNRGRFGTVELVDEIAQLVPDYLWFNKINEPRPGELELVGQTFSNLMVAELMRRMEASNRFSDVSIVQSEKEKSVSTRNPTGQPVLEFTLAAKIVH
ncbi:MAG: PilN domain-containing protein [Candidatus Eisenbacteria bacterium]|uniref:PilN domain-containing protein n=1 Tax=Eiseniibacteriota bacterium TaxID=2212470 RepID=A0A956LWM9_UNCEI|nr:PilN domain-containing protein [Candidatus Eisenbacteria bacterium]